MGVLSELAHFCYLPIRSFCLACLVVNLVCGSCKPQALYLKRRTYVLMTEFAQVLTAIYGAFAVGIYAAFCAFGGRAEHYLGIQNRTWGRIIAPTFLSLSLIILSLFLRNFSPWFLLSLISYKLSHHFGYGVNNGNVLLKILRRSSWCLVRTLACLPFVIPNGAWPLFFLQLTLSIITGNVLGIMNPVKSPVEEFWINLLSVIIVPLLVIGGR